MESEKYSVYTRVGTSNPPLLVLLGKSYKSSTGPIRVAKKALRQLMKDDSCIRRKQLYVRKHGSTSMKVYRASTRKITPKTVQIGNVSITYKMKPAAKYLKTLDEYRVVQSL